MSITTVEDLFSCADTVKSRSRFTLTGDRIPCASGGIVSRGHTAQGAGLLVHTDIPGLKEQNMDIGAVASAVVHGAIPYPSLILAFKREGKLAELEAAIKAGK